MTDKPVMLGKQLALRTRDLVNAEGVTASNPGRGKGTSNAPPRLAITQEAIGLGETGSVKFLQADADTENSATHEVTNFFADAGKNQRVLVEWLAGSYSIVAVADQNNGYPRNSQDCGCARGAIGTSDHECEDCGCVNINRYSTFPTFFVRWPYLASFIWEEAGGFKEWTYDSACLWKTESFDGPDYTCEDATVNDVYHWECDYSTGLVTLVVEGTPCDPLKVIKVIYCYDDSACTMECLYSWSFKVRYRSLIDNSLTFVNTFLPGTNFSAGNQGCKLCISPRRSMVNGQGKICTALEECPLPAYIGVQWPAFSAGTATDPACSGATIKHDVAVPYILSSWSENVVYPDHCPTVAPADTLAFDDSVRTNPVTFWTPYCGQTTGPTTAIYRTWGGLVDAGCTGVQNISTTYITCAIDGETQGYDVIHEQVMAGRYTCDGEDREERVKLKYRGFISHLDACSGDPQSIAFDSAISVSGFDLCEDCTYPAAAFVIFSDLPQPNNSGSDGDDCNPPAPPPEGDGCEGIAVYYKTVVEGQAVLLYSSCGGLCEVCGVDNAEYTAWVAGASISDVEQFGCACNGDPEAAATGPKCWYFGDGSGGWTLIYASPDCTPSPPGGASADTYTPIEGTCS